MAGAALIDRLLGHPVRVLGRAAADPAVERQLQGVVLVSLLVPALPGRLEDGADEAEVGGHPFGDEVVGKVGLPLQPFGEGLAGGAARIQRARAQEEDGPGGIAEAHLGPAVAAGQSVAGAVGAAIDLGDGAAVQPLERIGAEDLEVGRSTAHA